MTPLPRLHLSAQAIYRLQSNGFKTVEAVKKHFDDKGTFEDLEYVGKKMSDEIIRALHKFAPYGVQIHIVHQVFQDFLKEHNLYDEFEATCALDGYSFIGFLKFMDAMEQDPASYVKPYKRLMPNHIKKLWMQKCRLEGYYIERD